MLVGHLPHLSNEHKDIEDQLKCLGNVWVDGCYGRLVGFDDGGVREDARNIEMKTMMFYWGVCILVHCEKIGISGSQPQYGRA